MNARALLLVLALLLVPITGCAEASETAAPPERTVTVTVTEPAPPPPPLVDEVDEDQLPESAPPLASFDGDYFSLSYPAKWEVETAEISKGSYLDTTIRAPDRDVMVRVDVSPRAYSTPSEVAAEVEGYLRPQPRYRRLRYEATSFVGYEALRWDFLVEEDGVLLRKSDIFFTTEAGDGVAVLIQAPAARYGALAETLEAARDSLVIVAEHYDDHYDEDESYEEPAVGEDFCSTHDCIDNFEEGRGYVVQCADSTWSQSGGIQGACSHHGGVTGSSGGSSGSGDPNNDGSTTNWCGASRDGDGDGLWCEGR